MIGRVNTSGGGNGAALTVTAPAGSTVTVSKDGKYKTKVAGSDGIVVFKGLQSGTWNLSITDGEQTASKTVEIVADYSTSITFFAATISITYPPGAACTATDGTTTLTAPDTSGAWDCVVPNAGTWTIRSVNTAGTRKKVVSISGNGQAETCILGTPAEYQEVLYLQSTGTQFIMTGLTNCKSYRHRVVVKAQPTTADGVLYGEVSQPYNTLLLGDGSNLNYTSRYNGGSPGGSPTMNLGDTFTLERLCGEDGIVIVRNDGENAVTYDCSAFGFDNVRAREPFIFSRNNGGSADSKMKAKLYWLNVYDIDHTTPLREFVPCYRKADSVAGLYDLVNGVFYTNAGSGTFVVGGDV